MQVQKTNGINFKGFSVDQNGKEFISSLYGHTKQSAQPYLTEELRKFRSTMNLYAQKLEPKKVDIILTSSPDYPKSSNLSKLPFLSLKKDNKAIEDTMNTGSSIALYDLAFNTATNQMSKGELKSWFKSMNAEVKHWITLNYVDRFSDNQKSIKELITEFNRPASIDQTINAIF